MAGRYFCCLCSISSTWDNTLQCFSSSGSLVSSSSLVFWPFQAGSSCTWLKENPGVAQLVYWSRTRSEEHTSELQSHLNLVCRLLLEKKKNIYERIATDDSEKCGRACLPAASPSSATDVMYGTRTP